MRRRPTTVLLLLLLLLLLTTTTMAACGDPPRNTTLECDVFAPATTRQAVYEPPPQLQLALDDDLGGLVCTAGTSEGCADAFANDCVGDAEAFVGVAYRFGVVTSTTFAPVVVEGIDLDSECGWTLEDGSGYTLDGDSEVAIIVNFVGTAVGVCEGRLAFRSDSGGNGVETQTVTLRATVAEAAQEEVNR